MTAGQNSGLHPAAVQALTHHKKIEMLMPYTDLDMRNRLLYLLIHLIFHVVFFRTLATVNLQNLVNVDPDALSVSLPPSARASPALLNKAAPSSAVLASPRVSPGCFESHSGVILSICILYFLSP